VTNLDIGLGTVLSNPPILNTFHPLPTKLPQFPPTLYSAVAAMAHAKSKPHAVGGTSIPAPSKVYASNT